MSDRGEYYNKWDKFTKDSLESLDQEEEEARKAADEAVGKANAVHSEAEAKDKAKFAALKEAKKQWQDQQKKELAARMEIKGHENQGTVVLDSAKLQNKPVIVVKENKGCTFVLPRDLSHAVIKLFVESCEDCTLILEATTITQHVEMSHCENMTVRVKAPTSTLQADLCNKLTVEYDQGLLQDNHKLYHAGVSELLVKTLCGHETTADYVKDLEGHKLEQGKVLEEQQFVTHFVEGKLITEKCYRAKSNMPITHREAKLSDGPDDVQSTVRSAELKKIGGNEAFSEGNYAQAAIFYTEAIDLCMGLEEKTPVLHTSYSNRAACFLKLGHHEKALEDANACIEAAPEFVKGYFRKGLALHAMKQYIEAARVLSKALDMEPKNKQIKQALTFAEAKIRQQQQQTQRHA